MRLPQGLCPGPRRGAYSASRPQLEKVGSHTTLDHPVEKSFPRHCLKDGGEPIVHQYVQQVPQKRQTPKQLETASVIIIHKKGDTANIKKLQTDKLSTERVG